MPYLNAPYLETLSHRIIRKLQNRPVKNLSGLFSDMYQKLQKADKVEKDVVVKFRHILLLSKIYIRRILINNANVLAESFFDGLMGDGKEIAQCTGKDLLWKTKCYILCIN